MFPRHCGSVKGLFMCRQYYINLVVLSTNPPTMQDSGRCTVNLEQGVAEVVALYMAEWLTENKIDKGNWTLKNIRRSDGEETFSYTLTFEDGDVWFITGLAS